MTSTETGDRAEAAPRSTGRALGTFRAWLMVLEGHWTWYRRNWTATAVSSIGQPVLYLLAMGLGFGSQVRSTSMTGGMGYLDYLAPALLAATCAQVAVGESTHPILSGFKWQKVYWGMVATPITPEQVAGAALCWIALRLATSAVAYLAVAALVGALVGPGVLLALPLSVLCGMAIAAPVVAYSASLSSEGNEFNVLFRFVLIPMTLLAGTFFPVSQLPGWLRPVVWLTPLWHGTELARGAAFGSWTLWPTLGHIGYLLALFLVGVLLARWRFRVRLAA